MKGVLGNKAFIVCRPVGRAPTNHYRYFGDR